MYLCLQFSDSQVAMLDSKDICKSETIWQPIGIPVFMMASFSSHQDTDHPYLSRVLRLLSTCFCSVVRFIGGCQLNHVRTPITNCWHHSFGIEPWTMTAGTEQSTSMWACVYSYLSSVDRIILVV